MKAFSSRILSESSVNNFARKDNSIRFIKEAEESLLYKFLEFNEAAAAADVKSTSDYYYHLLKFASMDDAMEYDNAFTAIFNKYEAVRYAAYDLSSGYHEATPNYSAPLNNVYDKLSKMCEELSKQPIRTITVYGCNDAPNSTTSEVM